jgi:hypothetical protein
MRVCALEDTLKVMRVNCPLYCLVSLITFAQMFTIINSIYVQMIEKYILKYICNS